MAKVKQQFLDLDPGSEGYIDAGKLPFGASGVPLNSVLAGIGIDGLSGMHIVAGGGKTAVVQPGDVVLDGELYASGNQTTINIDNDRREGGALSVDTVYFVYAYVNVDGNLDYYFSEYEPLQDEYGNTASVYTRELAAKPAFHPIDGIVARHIGQVYVLSSGNIAPFTRCFPGYCESNWAGLPGNNGTTTIYHGLGFVPEFVDAVFSTTIDGSTIHPQPYHFSTSGWFGRVGVRVNGIDADSLGMRQESSGAFVDVQNGSVRTSGFIKVRMM